MLKLMSAIYCDHCDNELKLRGQDDHIGMVVSAIGYSYLDGKDEMCYKGWDCRAGNTQLDFCDSTCLVNYINGLKSRHIK